MEKLNRVRFAAAGKNSFHETLVKRVNAYFKENKISPYANVHMWIKTLIMLLLYFVPYLFMVSGSAAGNTWIFFGLWLLMAIGMVRMGTSGMHDANHGTYSPNRKVNTVIGSILEVIGGYTVTWKIQHNFLHHTYTNISGLDEDIETMSLLRFSPDRPYKPIHRFQYIYAWFFYMLMTLYWMTVKDFQQAVRYKQHDLLVSHKLSLRQAIFRISMYKLFYYAYVMVLPIIFSGFPWYYVLFGFIIMHFTAGLLLACIFQPSHIAATSSFELPVQAEGKPRMEDSWAIHEVENTTDFGQKSPFLTWFIGGLNFQIEHHLFTGICHVHYPKLAPIVKKTAEEYGIAYHVQPTFWRALVNHLKMLKKLGRANFSERQQRRNRNKRVAKDLQNG